MSRTVARAKPKARRAIPTRRPRQDTPRGYVCSRCSFHEELPEPDWFAKDCPRWPGSKKELAKSWLVCPNDGGPDTGMLTNLDRSYQRIRDIFPFGDDEIRACSPIALLSKSGRPQRLVSETDLRLNVYRDWYLEHYGPDPRMDLQRLAEATRGSFGAQVIKQDDVWTLPYGVSLAPDIWHRKIVNLWRTNTLARRYDFVEIAHCLEPRASNSPHNRAALLCAPFDLRFPVKPQLKRLSPLLHQLQVSAQSFTTTKTRRGGSNYLWRDTYIFLLKRTTKRTWSSIAEEVFPNDDCSSRPEKARTYFNRVVKALTEGSGAFLLEDAPTD